MKQTKEQLLVEVTKLRQSHEEWVNGDLKRRKEFARAFGWNKPTKPYDTQKELYEPSWVEIFVEIGKLLSARNFIDYEGNISELECFMSDAKRNFEELFSKKVN